MKIAKRFLFGAMAAFMMAACSEDKLGPDESGNNGGEASRDGVYLSVNIKMPTGDGSRSFTNGDNESSGGTEVGKDSENNINTVYLVLAKALDNTFIGWGEIPASGITKSTDGTTYKSVATLNKEQLSSFYESLKDDESRDVNVFVFCNPTIRIREILEAATQATSKTNAWINETGEYDATDANTQIIWSDNSFLMSNNAIAVRSLPKTFEMWDAFKNESHPFNLSDTNNELEGCDNSANAEGGRGPIKVERTAARFDFKDGSPLGNCTYNVIRSLDDVKMINGEMGKPYYINVMLNKMSLTNVNKKFYFLRRVSNDGKNDNTEGNDWQLCGPEKPWFRSIEDENGNEGLVEVSGGNYVVNPLASLMQLFVPNDFSSTYYNYPFFNSDGEIDNPTLTNWYTSEISNILKGDNDNYGNKEYHIWRYVTENTIPGVELQKNGQSTGIIFKGKLIATDEAHKSEDKNIAQLARLIDNKLTANDAAELKMEKNELTGYSDQDPIIYKFKGVRNNIGGMYASWQNVEQAAKDGAITPVWEADNTAAGGFWRLEINRGYTLYAAVYGVNGGCGSYTFIPKNSDGEPLEYDENGEPKTVTINDPQPQITTSPNYLWHVWDQNGRKVPKTGSADKEEFKDYYDFKKAAVAADFTLYQTSFDGAQEGEGEFGYYCYYYYWNRHNDNRQNGIMGPMEFAVVRNNVYKISVIEINNIGHPRTTINDPDKPTPSTDDEIDDVYITVDVDVLPWVVRENKVEF